MARSNRRTSNGFKLKRGDKIRLVGPKDRHNMVYFANEMEPYLGLDKIFVVKSVSTRDEGTTFSAAGWEWDIKYAEKICHEPDPASLKPQTKDTSLFDVKALVL